MADASGTGRTLRVVALLTSFNRRDQTIACLRALEASARGAGIEPHAVLVDDASTDGTAAAVRESFPWVDVVTAAGDLYWCRGMHRAFAHARETGADHYLWLNDDTLLFPDALQRLLSCHEQKAALSGGAVIVVGACRDQTGAPSYGGVRRATMLWPTRFTRVMPDAEAHGLHTFDGNVVLVSSKAAARVGNLDPRFEHAMGDYDYGLRALRLRVELWLAPGWYGLCDDNPRSGTFDDAHLPLSRRMRHMLSRKGLPPRSWWRFNRQHSGILWPLTFAWPYLRVVAQGLFAQRPGRARP